jgi:hypothetical protein
LNQAVNGKIQIEVRPMDSLATAYDLPRGSLGGTCTQQCGVKGQGHMDFASIAKNDNEAPGLEAQFSRPIINDPDFGGPSAHANSE